MAPKVKKWLFNPIFGAGSEGHEDRRGRHPTARAGGGDGGADAIAEPERAADYADKNEEDAVEDFNAPTRWWVYSTLFPLIAGTFGPMASAFNICAVAVDWRIYVDATSTESEGAHIPDPKWLVGINAVSLAIALISNISLLSHMTGRMRFSIAAPITIIGWYISGFIDIALVCAAQTHLPLPDATATYSQAYYYGCFAGAIYVLLSMMLTFTAFGVFIGHYSNSFKLTMSQRSLMLQTMLYLGYLLAAAAVYTKIEGWNFLDSVYYINVTLFTIGFGDFSPKTHLGRSLYLPMSIGGILFVGLIIANIRTLVLESAGRKISTRMVEKARFKALSSGNPSSGIIKLRGIHTRHINGATELERREQEYQIMREVHKQAAQDNRLMSLIVSASCFFILWLVGAVVFWQSEMSLGGQNWSYFEALYFTYTSLLTIGYGDFYPQTNSGKPSFVFWSLLALPTLTVLIGTIGDAMSDFVSWATDLIGTHTSKIKKAIEGMKDAKNRKQLLKEAMQDDKESPNDFTAIQAHKDDGFDSMAQAEALNAVDNLLPDGDNVRKIRDKEDADAAAYHYRPYIIMREMKNVVEHLDSSPPRQYTFAEWTWLLRLLGEDESLPDGHRRPGHPHNAHKEIAPPLRDGEHQAWSWMGQESPLMTFEDEPKWVMKKLMIVLEKELKKRGDVEMVQHLEKRYGDESSTEKGTPLSGTSTNKS